MRFLLLFFILPFLCRAQVNTTTWGVDDTSICIVKSTDFFMVHDYIAMENFSGSPLNMVWVRHTAPDWPVQWEAGFTDPDSFYTDVLVVDTGYFVLPFPVEFSNQLIIDVDHNNQVDTSYLKFKVYPENFPEDSLWLTYCVIIHLPDVGYSENTDNFFDMGYIPEQRLLHIQGTVKDDYQFQLFNIAGEMVLEQSLHEESVVIDLSTLTTGVYAAYLHSPLYTFSQKIVIY